MKINKTIGAIAVIFFVQIAILSQTSQADIANSANTSTKEKLPVFLSEVIGLDLTKYNKTNEGYSVSYPSEFGGLVKREQTSFKLESKSSNISAAGIFDNGLVFWIYFYPINGSMIYSKQPSTDALDESKNIFQRYHTFCQRYNIDCSHVATAINMCDQLPTSTSTKSSGNINQMKDFIPANITQNNMKLLTKQTSIRFDYTVNDVDVPNKCIVMNFGYNTFTFSDTWNLYGIGSLSALSKEEVTNLAFIVAKNYSLTLEIGGKPDWSKMRSDVGLSMILGQTYNNSAGDDTHYVNVGNATRHPLMLYPLWQTIFYFSEPIGNVDGIQVGIWGDTKEVAYCDVYGFLGSSGQTSTSPDQSPTALLNEVVIALVLAVAIILLATALIVKNKRK
jgi:hypothetical protein